MTVPPRTASILHAADYGPKYSGNFIASLRALGRECNRHGLRMIWVFPDVVADYEWFDQLTREGDSCAYTLPRTATYLTNGRALARIARHENVRLLHTHFSSFDLPARWAQFLLNLRGQRLQLVWHVHSAFTDERWKRRAMDFLKIGIAGRSCEFIPVSSTLADSVARRGCPPTRLHPIDNGIDLAHATVTVRTRDQIRQEWQIPGGTTALLGFGWTPIRKGVDTMLEALSILRQRGMDVVLIVAGTGELKTFLDEWPDCRIRAYVRVIPPAERVAELFSAADIFLSPSRAEGWCYSVAEAMLNRIPVVAANVPALAYAQTWPGVHFCEVGSGPSLAATIIRIAAVSDAERRAEENRAFEFIYGNYSSEHWAKEVWALYERLIWGVAAPGLTAIAANT